MSRNKQQGVVLWVSLIVLVVMMAATVAILRSTSTGQNIAGNLGFKQNAVTASDLAVEQAIAAVLAAGGAALDADISAQGYYATWNGGMPAGQVFNPATVDWGTLATVNATPTGGDGTGNDSVRYVIHRMCLNSGSVVAAGQVCSFADADPPGTKLGDSPTPAGNVPTQAFYRVTVRITGPRNTLTFTQAMISIDI